MNSSDRPLSSPWKGLHFYTEEDRDVFFGRGRQVDELLRLIQRDTLTVLFARSGLGKTSLLRAGVIPRLREQGFLPVIVRVDYAPSALPPGEQIVAAALAAAESAHIEVEAPREPGRSPPGEITLWEFFHRHLFWTERNDPVLPALILDQFEEAFTLGRQSARASELLSQVADLAENRTPRSFQARAQAFGARPSFDTRAQVCKLILSLREDYVSKLDLLRASMPAVMRNRFSLAPLDRERGVEVVRLAGGRWVTARVAAEIVAAVAGESRAQEPEAASHPPSKEIEPAYLSVMCDELFRRMVQQGKDSIDSGLLAAERGDIVDGLYRRSFAGLQPSTRAFVEDRLLTATGFRGSVPLAEAQREGIPPGDLERLVDSRLLRFEDWLGTTHVELSHDLLTPIVRTSRDERWAAARAQAEREAERVRQAELAAQLRRTRRRASAAIAGVLLLLGGIGAYFLCFMQTFAAYSRDFTKRDGKYYPLGPLPSKAVQHRQWTLRATREGWLSKDFKKAELVGADGQLSRKGFFIHTYFSFGEEDDRSWKGELPSQHDYVYDNSGNIAFEVASDRFNQMAWGLVYVPHLKHGGGAPRTARATFLGPDGYPQPQGQSQAEYVEISYDQNGYEKELYFTDWKGSPVPGPGDVFGLRMQYDDLGRLIGRTSLDEQHRPTYDRDGAATVAAEYDREGNVVEETVLDIRGEPTLSLSGYHRKSTRYDRWGRETEVRFYGLSDEPTVETKEFGAHHIKYEYDDHGNVTNMKLRDSSDWLMDAKPRDWDFSAHEQRATFDELNRERAVAYFDTIQDKPLTGPEGYHQVHLKYDDRDLVSEVSYFDERGRPVNNTSIGAHSWRTTHDNQGRPAEERFFDTEGRAVATLKGSSTTGSGGGYHIRRNEYDRSGNLVAQSYFDANGKPVADLNFGAYRYEAVFDRFRHRVVALYLDEAGQPINNLQGFHKELSKFNDFGLEFRTRWFDKNGLPAKGPDGVHCVQNTFDGRGLLKRSANYADDAGNLPATDRYGDHEVVNEYNERRQLTRYRVFGLDRRPAEDRYGNHVVFVDYDEHGRETRATKLRADGSSNYERGLGIATVRHAFGREGRTEKACYDAADRLAICPQGYAKALVVYEPDGRMAEFNLGVDGKPAFNPLIGFAIRKTDSRRYGDTVDSYCDVGGELVMGPLGFAERRRHWGDDGRPTPLSEAFFGPDGAPVAGPGGFHRSERSPGSDTLRYFDSQGHKLAKIDATTVTSVIYVDKIAFILLPSALAGVRAGDVLWRYGSWYYPEVLAAEQARGIKPELPPSDAAKAFFSEVERLGEGPVRMTVFRDGRPVEILIPPLSSAGLGVQLRSRLVPISTFQEWKALAD